MEGVGDDSAEDLVREAPERREAAARAAASVVGRRRRREHRGELVEVEAFVVRPTARVDHFLDVRVAWLLNQGRRLAPARVVAFRRRAT